MKTYLFQGDSITDASRVRDWDMSLGSGYATTIASIIGTKYSGKLNFINRGISGNRIVDLYARIKSDIINLKPDYLSILIGINDVWHELSYQNGVKAEKFEKVYSMLIEEIFEELPNIKIYILEPFIGHGTASDEHWDYFYSETRKRAEAAKRVADKYSLPFITLQDKFEKAEAEVSCTYWTSEGVHPSAMGHGIIANALMEVLEKDI